MKSPFPGMDPYLEQFWRDVHHGLITYARDQLQPNLPESLRARMEERVFVESDDAQYRSPFPDVPLDLQALIDQCYQNGRYDDLDYQAQPIPPLEAPDAEWTEELLRSKGLR